MMILVMMIIGDMMMRAASCVDAIQHINALWCCCCLLCVLTSPNWMHSGEVLMMSML